MPPLLADFTHARPCKPFCEKYLTLPRDLYPDVYKTDVFVDVAEEVLNAIRDQQQDDAAY